jgi:hypothetical protein
MLSAGSSAPGSAAANPTPWYLKGGVLDPAFKEQQAYMASLPFSERMKIAGPELLEGAALSTAVLGGPIGSAAGLGAYGALKANEFFQGPQQPQPAYNLTQPAPPTSMGIGTRLNYMA